MTYGDNNWMLTAIINSNFATITLNQKASFYAFCKTHVKSILVNYNLHDIWTASALTLHKLNALKLHDILSKYK